MSRLERSARAIRAEIAQYHAAAETPPKMAQRRAALFLRPRKENGMSAVQEETIEQHEVAGQGKVSETSVSAQHGKSDTPEAPQPKPLAFFFPVRPENTGVYAPSLKRRAYVRRAEIAALEEAEAQFKLSAASTRFFRSSPSREAAALASLGESDVPSERQAPDVKVSADVDQSAKESTSSDPISRESDEEKSAAKEVKEKFDPKKITGALKSHKKWGLVGAAVLLCAGYVGIAAANADVVAKETTVAGVDIGSLSPKEAAVKLNSELGDKTSTQFAVTLPDSDEEILVDPENYGLTLDTDETVNSVSGFSLAPTSVAAHLFGGSEHDPIIHYDDVKLAEQLQEIQSHVEGGYVNASIAFDNIKPTLVPAQDGLGIDREEATDFLTQRLFSTDKPLALSLSQMSPPVNDDAAQEAIEKYARPLVKAPFTIEFNEKDYEVSPQDLVDASSFVPLDNELVLVLDGDSLADIVEKEKPEGVVFGKDAQIKIVNHDHVEIVPSTDGVGIDREKLSADIVSSLAGDDRRVVAQLGAAPARFTTEDAQAMGVTEIVASIDTPHRSNYSRKMNLKVGAERSSGVLIRPGETFSLLETIGPVTIANGYYSAGVVVNGFHSNGAGGGLSQITTNTFNLGYQAGYVDVEHHPHTNYFTRYPKGHEATLSDPEYDMKWTNNTPYGAIIDTWVDDGYVHSRLWSTKYWDVTITTSEMRNIRPAGTITRPAGPGCTSYRAGHSGFSITVTRTGKHGDEEWSETTDVTYRPDNGVSCVKPPEPKPSAAPNASAESAQ